MSTPSGSSSHAVRDAHADIHQRPHRSFAELAATVPAAQPGEHLVTIAIRGDQRDLRFPARVTDARWNGAVMPSFRRKVAEIVIDWTNLLHVDHEDNYYGFWDGATAVLVNPAFPDDDPERIDADDDGRYGIGACLWTWKLVDDSDDLHSYTVTVLYGGDPAEVINVVIAALDQVDSELDPTGERRLGFQLADRDDATVLYEVTPHPAGQITCKFCHQPAPASTAHRHQRGWVGDNCCWDERLRATE